MSTIPDAKTTTEPASLSAVFGLPALSSAELAQRLANFNGKASVYKDGTRTIQTAPDTKATPDALAAFDKAIDDEPFTDDDQAAIPETIEPTEATTHSPVALPDLTTVYLDQLVGWHRQKTGLNPRANCQTVWVKDRHDQWQNSPHETWPGISQAILRRERNVQTPAANLFEHVRNMRIDMTPAILNQLLDWYYEKTGKEHRKNQTVWIKDGRGEWDIALFRWSDVDSEFRYADVRQRMGADDLQHYKHKRLTTAIDLMVYAQGAVPKAQP